MRGKKNEKEQPSKIMETQQNLNFNPHVSVDCVILGFDGDSLQVLLSRQSDEAPQEEYHSLKLPGRLLYADEDIDDAAKDIINQLTGTDNHYVRQFRAFGSLNRTSNPKDTLWLENVVKLKIDRIVTIAYISLIKINNRTHRRFAGHDVGWYKVADLPQLAFDHNHIIEETMSEVYNLSSKQPELLFEMLPSKFTALQLRKLHEQISGKEIDVRNFSKLVMSKPYIVPTDEWETGVSHRAARYFKFQTSKTK